MCQEQDATARCSPGVVEERCGGLWEARAYLLLTMAVGKQATLACSRVAMVTGPSRPVWELPVGTPRLSGSCLLGSRCWGDAASILPQPLWVLPSLSRSDG
ncbi:hypothetical protein MDA_GLEAN10011827 [Myotis davidii]|uniref:Uncharacterized protein n=1 Tax=Myotis davidii TaxID=225400 RepID=L5MGN6_MYODS|nr:hypothetical protein MDA_GLEAN10011827 [Myotis davidii]